MIGINFKTLKRMGVESLAVFGSTARGEAKPGSDVDLLVGEMLLLDRRVDCQRLDGVSG